MCVCVCFFIFSFFLGGCGVKIVIEAMMWNLTGVESQRDKEMELHQTNPFCQSTEERKSLGWWWGSPGTHTRFVPCPRRSLRELVVQHVFPCLCNKSIRGTKLSTIEFDCLLGWVALSFAHNFLPHVFFAH